jgi:hypothetical protein
MNAIALKNALHEVLRDYHAENNEYAHTIKETILVWYYTTYITAEDCVDLLVEYLTTGNLSLTGKFERRF